MTAVVAYELATQGGATDFACLIAACEAFEPYCLIGGLAVNCFVEPVYTLDAEVVAPYLPIVRIEFKTEERYQAFPVRAGEAEVLGVRVKIACLEDVTQGKLWAYTDPRRLLGRRRKDELDLIREERVAAFGLSIFSWRNRAESIWPRHTPSRESKPSRRPTGMCSQSWQHKSREPRKEVDVHDCFEAECKNRKTYGVGPCLGTKREGDPCACEG